MAMQPTSRRRGAEWVRLAEDERREQNWKRWGTYLAERQWGTVREDYSAGGDSWRFFPHDHARSRAYRWGEDGLLGLTDRQGRLAFALALWNGHDSILKERLFGLTGPEGNHGEDVKEVYFYLDATPTCSWARGLYKYPVRAFPYTELAEVNAQRGKLEREYELVDTGVFDDGYFDVEVRYAKASPDDVLVEVHATCCAPRAANLWILPTLWFRNTWSLGRVGEAYDARPEILLERPGRLRATHGTLGPFVFDFELERARPREVLFTENETNLARLFGSENWTPWVKDAFHRHVVEREPGAVSLDARGTKAAPVYECELDPGETLVLRFRLSSAQESTETPFDEGFQSVVAARESEADEFYESVLPTSLEPEGLAVSRQAYAGLIWTKQFYHYSVVEWLEGDPTHPAPPESRRKGRNREWKHLYNRDVISMPDKWEYPWYAAWDLAFHMVPFARIDPEFAKSQLTLLLREWYMHPNGQIPAYEFCFSDVNPPVHAWAAWRVYKIAARQQGVRDRIFLESVFHKLLVNFTWWVNQKDTDGNHVFSGGFLGLDNIGVFDRSRPLPTGGHIEQADGTSWMAFYCATMLSIALELAREDPSYGDIASKFLEHFVAISDAINSLDGTGLWDEEDGFYFDHIHVDGAFLPLRTRSTVGLLPLVSVEVLDAALIDRLPGFKKRFEWFLENRPDLAREIVYRPPESYGRGVGRYLLAIPSRERLERILARLFDESEFLGEFGVRSLSRQHAEKPFVFEADGVEHRVSYVPGESDSYLFGGNSNWRGPIWFPVNWLLIEALERYDYFWGDELSVELPRGSGRRVSLREGAEEIARRLTRIFLPGADGARPCHGGDARFRDDPRWREHLLFHEYFHGEDGRGLGASHQTGWTALVVRCFERLAKDAHPESPEA